MKIKNKYIGRIRYNNRIIHSFKANDFIYSVAKITRLVSDEYPYAAGELIDLKFKKIIYKCKKIPTC